jgi:aspartate/methionine/tyrosine aminotransferase
MAGLAALTGPMDEVRRMAATFAQRRTLVVDGLNRLPGVGCRMPGGAFYAFPNIRGTGIASRDLARRLLEEAHVALVPGEGFGDNGRGFLRVSYAASSGEIEEALARMAKFLAANSPASTTA